MSPTQTAPALAEPSALSPYVPVDVLVARGEEALIDELSRILPGAGDRDRLEVAAFNSSI